MALVTVINLAGPALERLQRRLESDAFKRACGAGAARVIRQHFAARESQHKRFPGGQPTHFWAGAARSIHVEATGTGALVGIAKQGVRQRWLGGIITPKNGPKFLTIPARGEAYGKRAREFKNLAFAMTGQGPALVESAATPVSLGRKRKDGRRAWKARDAVGGAVMFWLRRRVTQDPDPSVMPAEEAMLAGAAAGGRDHLLGEP